MIEFVVGGSGLFMLKWNRCDFNLSLPYESVMHNPQPDNSLVVHLMRHAKSSWDNPADSDHDRPLNQRGRRDLPRVGAWFAEARISPDVCLASSARRTEQTAESLYSLLDFPAPVRSIPQLYLASVDTIIDVLNSVEPTVRTVLLIGHNPGLEQLVACWSGSERHFPTAAVASFSFPECTEWNQLSMNSQAELLQFQVPKMLKD